MNSLIEENKRLDPTEAQKLWDLDLLTLGAAADRTWTRPGVLRRVLGALAGAAFAYVLDLGLSRLFPAFRAMVPAGWVPQPAALADGLLTGGFMGLGIACMSPSFSPDS